MANEGDLASVAEEFHLEHSLRLQQAQSAPGLAPKGLCHYCEEDVKPGQIFCDGHCAADYEYEMKRKRVNGR